jgi:hypothetical protein
MTIVRVADSLWQRAWLEYRCLKVFLPACAGRQGGGGYLYFYISICPCLRFAVGTISLHKYIPPPNLCGKLRCLVLAWRCRRCTDASGLC